MHFVSKIWEIVCKFVEHFTSHPELLLIVAAYLSASTFLYFFRKRRAERVYQCNWYDLSSKGPNEEMCFSQIKKIMDRDPLDPLEECIKKRRPCEYVVLSRIAFVVFLLVTFCVIFFVYSYPNTISKDNPGFIIPSGLLALVGTIVVVSYQIRLRARSSNRQEWINAIRKEISILIDSFPPPGASRRSIEATNVKMKQHLMNLDLYLNPSETVHRAFLEVLRFMYGFRCSENISTSQSRRLCMRRILCIPESRFDWEKMEEVCAEAEWEKWYLRAVRLANVLLKREWEQVKHVR